MNDLSVWPTDRVERILDIYGNTLYRICFVMLSNEADAEDAVQDTLMRYLQKAPEFESSDHEKAWLITTAKNKCRDMLRGRKRYQQMNIECGQQDMLIESVDRSVMEALMSLPEKYKIVLILYYVEEYCVNDIAKMIKRTPSAVKMRLKKGRELLKTKYREEYM